MLQYLFDVLYCMPPVAFHECRDWLFGREIAEGHC